MVKRVRSLYGFTLVELLVVLAILAILAAILFPVFRSAKASAEKTVCVSNNRQAQTATVLYIADYDDRFMPVNHNVVHVGDGTKDRTWVQLLMPYGNTMGIHRCPSDYGTRSRGDGQFDIDLVVGDAHQRYYNSSLRSNLGYNYIYFSPVYREGTNWVVRPKSMAEIAEPNKMLLFLDSVHRRNSNGRPEGGGSYIVLPPCRYELANNRLIDTFNIPLNAEIYTPHRGWKVTDPLSTYRFGMAWPWHMEKLNASVASGTVKSISPNVLTAGCDVRDFWNGYIKDTGRYEWDNQ